MKYQLKDDLHQRILLEMNFNRCSLDIEDPGEYQIEFTGKVIYVDWETEKEKIIGEFEFSIIDMASATENRLSLFDVFDSDGTSFKLYEQLMNKDFSFKKKVDDILGDGYDLSSKIMLINRIGIIPEFRGHKLGKLILANLIQRFSMGASIIAIEPSPFIFTSEDIKSNSTNCSPELKLGAEEKRKLSLYYQTIGFKEIPGSDFLLLNNACIIPDIE